MTKSWILALPVLWLASSSVLAGQAPEATACVYLIDSSSGQKMEQHNTTPWYFWRNDNRVETRDAHGETGEIWEPDPRGQISYIKLFHPGGSGASLRSPHLGILPGAGKAIDYTSGDLRALAMKADWNQIRSIIDPTLLGTRLKRTGEQTFNGQHAELYVGEVDGVSTEVLWLPQTKLPARVEKIQGGVTVRLRMAECKPLASAPWTMTSDTQMQSYQHLDYADLGDKENDPFVKSVIGHNAGLHHGH